MTSSTPHHQLWINGNWENSETNERRECICPGDGEVLATIAEANANDVDKAVNAAHTAFTQSDWSSVRSGPSRANILRNIAARMRDKVDELATLESLDAGKTITESNLVDVHFAADCFEFYADLASHISGEVLPAPMDALDFTWREPLGVCASVVAWNFPLMFVAWKVAPALAAGNTVVLKPAELTSLSALKMAEIFSEASVPNGVVNIVTGRGSVVGEALSLHPLVKKMSFTGSTAIGKRVMQNAASNCKKVTLELGGKSPNIVFDDAELDKAVSGALTGIFYNAGQCCIAGSRLFIHEKIYNAFIEQLVTRTKKIKVGHPLDWEARMGAMVTAEHKQRVLGYIAKAKQEGAELLCGGGEPSDYPHPKGHYVEPTIFACKNLNYQVAQEEIFGPVLSVIPFSEEEEVIAMANDTEYGLAGAVWTNNIKRAFRVAKQIQAGQVWINNYTLLTPWAPHGGYKQSGFGKDLSKYALEEYTQVKNVFVDLSTDEFLTIYE